MKTNMAEHARSALRGALEGIGATAEPSSLARLLESVGRLELLEPGRARSMVSAEVAGKVDGWLAAPLSAESLSGVGIEALAVEVLNALDDRDDDDSLPESDHEVPLTELRRALEARDRVELALYGAEVLRGRDPDVDDELAAELDAFEEILRPELWRLTVTNADRARPLAFVPSELRDRFWWRFDGVDLDPNAADSLPAVATLISRYPEARSELERLVAADEAWSAPRAVTEATVPTSVQEATPSNVVSLAAWVGRRARKNPNAGVEVVRDREGRLEPVALAAAPPDAELSLLELPEVELSFRAPRELVVDVLADRDPSKPISLRQEDGRVNDLTPVPHAIERFSIELEDPLLHATGVVLRVPLAGGTLEIHLPPEEG